MQITTSSKVSHFLVGFFQKELGQGQGKVHPITGHENPEEK
jgi:hypothetical protein